MVILIPQGHNTWVMASFNSSLNPRNPSNQCLVMFSRDVPQMLATVLSYQRLTSQGLNAVIILRPCTASVN